MVTSGSRLDHNTVIDRRHRGRPALCAVDDDLQLAGSTSARDSVPASVGNADRGLQHHPTLGDLDHRVRARLAGTRLREIGRHTACRLTRPTVPLKSVRTMPLLSLPDASSTGAEAVSCAPGAPSASNVTDSRSVAACAERQRYDRHIRLRCSTLPRCDRQASSDTILSLVRHLTDTFHQGKSPKVGRMDYRAHPRQRVRCVADNHVQ